MRLSEPTTKIWMKIDPYCQWQKCILMILVSGDVRFMRIFAEIPWEGVSKESGVVDNGNFQRFRWPFLETLRALILFIQTLALYKSFTYFTYLLEMRTAFLHNNTQFLVSFSAWSQKSWPWMTSNGYFVLNSKFGLARSDLATFEK